MRRVGAVVTCAAVAAAALALGPPVAAAPSSQGYLVEVLAGVDPAVAAARVKVTPTYLYRAGLNGYAASLTSSQLNAVSHDAATASVQLDAVRTLPAEKITPLPPQPPQFVTTGVRRVGGLLSPTARIDGRDERVDVDVAVIDDGVDTTHPDLNVAGVYNCVESTRKTIDPGEHGTLVSGFIGALDNGFGAVGVAPGARIWGVQAGNANGNLPESRILCALDWVVAHADVIDVVNMSYGGYMARDEPCVAPGRAGNRNGQRDLEHELICALDRAGVVLVAAAGNDASDQLQYPSSYPEVIGVSALADSDGRPGGLGADVTCTSLGAGQQRDDDFAFFSNYGRNAVLAAPGVCISSTFPGARYATGTGTSFSSPLVAGGAALYLHTHPTATPVQVRAALLAAAEPGPIPGDPDDSKEPVLDVSSF